MDVVINELSLKGQYHYEGFINYLEEELIPILKIVSEKDMLLFKKSDIYSYKVTKDLTLYDLLVIRGEPAVAKLKSQLVSIYQDEPFWDLDYQTDISCNYSSKCFSTIPNGITEACARNSILLSFDDSQFQEELIYFDKDNLVCEVKNYCFFHLFQEYLKHIGLIDHWYKNSFRIVIGYFFEIRFNESNHKKSHFHVKKGDYSGSYSIPEFDRLKGNIPRNDEKEILVWAQGNKHHIIDMWNRLHTRHQQKQLVFLR